MSQQAAAASLYKMQLPSALAQLQQWVHEWIEQ
jgi:hypothetical protein